MIQANDIADLVGVETPEAAALKTLIQCRFFERLVVQSQTNIVRDWRGMAIDERPKNLNEHATLQTICESFISFGEVTRNQTEA